MKVCPVCSNFLKEKVTECPNCGAAISLSVDHIQSSEYRYNSCPHCQAINVAESQFCNRCGYSLTTKLVAINKRVPAKHNSLLYNLQAAKRGRESFTLPSQLSRWILLGGVIAAICSIVFFGMSTKYRFANNFIYASSMPVVNNQTASTPVLNDQLTMDNTSEPISTELPTDFPLPAPFLPTEIHENWEPTGKIVFSCQIYGEGHDQICIVNSDGSEWRQLTNNDKHNWYPSIAPDGNSVVYSSNLTGRYQIFKISVNGGDPVQVNYDLGVNLYSPEISPDGSKIVFSYEEKGVQSVWVMDIDGGNPHKVSPGQGLDPTWSPDGSQILFTSSDSQGNQLFVINADGTKMQKVTNMNNVKGRSDWSPSGEFIVTYAGKFGARSIFLVRLNDSVPLEYFFPPTSAYPSFSLDEQWMTFSGYIDFPDDFDNGCEIYLVRLDDSQTVIRLTNNNYCDWQPRWGS